MTTVFDLVPLREVLGRTADGQVVDLTVADFGSPPKGLAGNLGAERTAVWPYCAMRWGASRPRREAPRQSAQLAEIADLKDANVLLVGLFSAKRKDYNEVLENLAQHVRAQGARVVGRLVQRRGVSAGGVKKMNDPLSTRTLVTPGKVRQMAATIAQTGANLVIFTNVVTERQRAVLQETLEVKVMSAGECEPSWTVPSPQTADPSTDKTD